MLLVPTLAKRSPCIEKHDKLGWTSGFSLQVGQKLLGFRCNSQDITSEVKSRLPDLETSQGVQVNRLVSLRVGPKSNRRGLVNYNIVYLGHRVVKKTLDILEAQAEAEKLLQLETTLLRDDLAHVASHLFCYDSRLLVSLTGPTDLCSQVVGEVLERVEPDASAFSSFSPTGQVLYRPVYKAGEHTALRGLSPLSWMIHLEHPGQLVRTPGELVLALYARTNGGLRGAACLEAIAQAQKGARAVIVPHQEDPGKYPDLVLKLLTEPPECQPGQVLRLG